MAYREELCGILLEENRLMEIVKLIGADVLPDDQKLIIEIARVVRVRASCNRMRSMRRTPMFRWKSS